MMNRLMEKSGLWLIGVAVIAYLVLLVVAAIKAFPVGVIALLVIGGCALILLQAVKDRLGNKEDDYYSKNVQK